METQAGRPFIRSETGSGHVGVQGLAVQPTPGTGECSTTTGGGSGTSSGRGRGWSRTTPDQEGWTEERSTVGPPTSTSPGTRSYTWSILTPSEPPGPRVGTRVGV